ncbi:MAG TPA: VTT domain-containing protein, partial [Candidatus Polarisedimenticolia bacterium]|nr:VTT domain-containing protein [Candidatus Polarisedimenticolia bacterium]
AAVDAAVRREGGKIVLLMRLSPVFPFNLLNYMFGLTGVGFWRYLLASWAGMLPATFLYVQLGFAGRVAAGAATTDEGVQMSTALIWGAGLVATALLTWYLTRLASRALKAASG